MNRHNPLWTAMSKDWIKTVREILSSYKMHFDLYEAAVSSHAY